MLALGVPSEVTPAYYLVLGALLFGIGAFGLLIRRNPLVMFMCVELMLNAVTLTFVTFSRMLDDVGGQSIVVFVLVVAAAEVVVGLAIIVSLLRKRPEATADDLALLEG
jgi:NADH-quinone oxidoreductase subunit K